MPKQMFVDFKAVKAAVTNGREKAPKAVLKPEPAFSEFTGYHAPAACPEPRQPRP